MSNQVLSKGNSTDWPSNVVIYTDGASRGNPGPASVGIFVTDENENTIFEYAESLGNQTNNFAEYTAVIKAFQFCVENSVEKVTLKSDSQLLIRQLLGQYKVKSAAIKPLFRECFELLNKIPQRDLVHVKRELNTKADELANIILDI